jgi:beta-aspartyl-dipeptidase (metallo-type)
MRYLDSGAPAERITISSDGGGCLPVFNDQGEITEMDIGRPTMLAFTLKALLDQGQPLERVLPAFTSNVASILRLHDKGRVRAGGAADLIVLDDQHDIDDVMIAGIWHVKNKQQQIFGQFEKTDAQSS